MRACPAAREACFPPSCAGPPCVSPRCRSACRLLDGLLIALCRLAGWLLGRCLLWRLLARALGALRRDEQDGLIERDLLRLAIPRQRGIDLAVLDVRPVAAGQNLHLAAKLRVLAKLLDDVGAAASARGCRLLGEKAHRAVQADLEHLFGGAEARILAVVLDIGSKAAEARRDRLARFRVQPDLAGEREERERAGEIDTLRIVALRDRGAFRLFGAILLAELNVRSEPSGAERDVEPGLRIGAEHLAFGKRRHLAIGVGELARVAAVRIVGAADKGAELAHLETETARGA